MRKLIIANWKMNGNLPLVRAFTSATRDLSLTEVEVVICLPAPYLHAAGQQKDLAPALGAQNCAGVSNGAHTGEVSAQMLQEFGTSYCLVGHSERRQDQMETDESLAGKLQQLDIHGVMPVVCVGETLAERDRDSWRTVLATQLSILSDRDTNPIVIAYEPVWAIGTGRVPTDSEIEEAISFIRTRLTDLGYPARSLRVLYGGSANADNAAQLLSLASVDGLLVGGASLDPQEFAQMIEITVDAI